MENKNTIRAILGTESLLLVLPKRASLELGIINQDWLNFEIIDRQLVIKKLVSREKLNIE